MRGVVGKPEAAQQASACEAKASFSSTTSKSAGVRPSRSRASSPPGWGRCPSTRGATPAVAQPSTRAIGVQAVGLRRRSDARTSAAAPSLTPEALPAVTLPSGRHDAAQLRQRLAGRRGAGCSSFATGVRRPCGPGRRPATISASKHALRFGRRRALLRAQRESVLIRARHAVNSSATFSAVSGIESTPYCVFIAGVDEAPADRRVVDVRRALEGRLGLAHDEGRARHAFDAAGDGERRLARLDRARGGRDRVHARAAEAVHRYAGHASRAGLPAAAPCGRRLRLSSPAWLARAEAPRPRRLRRARDDGA